MFGSESDGDSTLSRSSSGSVNANPTTHSRRVPTLAEAAKAEARAASGRRRRRSSVPSGSSISGSSSAGSVDHSAKSDSGSAGAGGGASAGAGGGVHVPPPGASTGSDGLKLKGTPLFDHAPIRTYTGHSVGVPSWRGCLAGSSWSCFADDVACADACGGPGVVSRLLPAVCFHGFLCQALAHLPRSVLAQVPTPGLCHVCVLPSH